MVPICGPRGGGEKFEVPYVYFGFYSVTGCSFTMEAVFVEPAYKTAGIKKIEDKDLDEMDDSEYLVIREYQ